MNALKRGRRPVSASICQRWVCVTALALCAAPRHSMAAPAAPAPAPVQSLEARDLPLDKKGAEGELAARLKPFDVKPETFTYHMRLLAREEEGVDVYRLDFPSPVKTRWAENNTVPAEYYVPADPKEFSTDGKLPAAIALDISVGSAIVPRVLARAAARRGVAMLYVPMPYYNDRRPRDRSHELALADDPAGATVEALRQTVM